MAEPRGSSTPAYRENKYYHQHVRINLVARDQDDAGDLLDACLTAIKGLRGVDVELRGDIEEDIPERE